MTEKKLTVQEQAALTAAEIRRRGWTRYMMAQLHAQDDFDKYAKPKPEALRNCKVCLVGGAAAALEGDPQVGHNWWNSQFYPELLEAVADRVAPDWRDRPDFLFEFVTGWNDRQVSVDPVLALLDDIANSPAGVAA